MPIRAAALLSLAILLAIPATASADFTAFLGTNPTPVNRVTTGLAVGVGLVIVGFEFEYGHTRENFDELAPSLSMWVVTEPTVAAIAMPTTDGRFTLAIEEAGQYTLQAYFAGEPVGRPITVSVDRRDVDVSGRPLVLATKPPVEDNTP